MQRNIRFFALMLAVLLAFAGPATAQGNKGGDKPKQAEAKGGKAKAGKAEKPDHGAQQNSKRRDDSDKPGKRDDDGRKNDDRGNDDRGNRKFSGRASDRVAEVALDRGRGRGLRDGDVVVKRNGNRVSLTNRKGDVLVDMDENRARNLGAWRVRPVGTEMKEGAPSFCRSGAGHPVFGRQWCVDKGFGLGNLQNTRWGTIRGINDIELRAVDQGTLARNVLIDILGDVVFNRLGVHAVTLGYTDPLTGVWIGDNSGPRVLRITSGTLPVAEIIDDNRDNRADGLLVALRL